MTLKDVTQLPLWEHAAESGRFAEYAEVGSAIQPWKLVGKGVLSVLTFLGGVADFVQFGALSASQQDGIAAAADQEPGAAPDSVKTDMLAGVAPPVSR